MQITYTKAFGNDRAEFSIDEKDDKKAFEMLAFLSTPDKCYLPGFEQAPVTWNVRRAQGKEGTDRAGQTFMYVERKARNAKGEWATSQMGEYQNGGFFWKRWEVYQKNVENAGEGQNSPTTGQYDGDPNSSF